MRFLSEFTIFSLIKLGDVLSRESIKQLDNSGLLARNFDRPPLKDTIDVPSGGYTILRFIADNDGVWMFHCHTEWHLEMGMSLLFKVRSSKPKKNIKNSQECYQRIEPCINESNFLTFKAFMFIIILIIILNNVYL